jgi:hypothetical protein
LHFSIYSECHCHYITIKILQQKNTNIKPFCQYDIQESHKGNIIQRLLNDNVYSVLILALQTKINFLHQQEQFLIPALN